MNTDLKLGIKAAKKHADSLKLFYMQEHQDFVHLYSSSTDQPIMVSSQITTCIISCKNQAHFAEYFQPAVFS